MKFYSPVTAIAPKEEISPTIDEYNMPRLEELNDMDLFSCASDESDGDFMAQI